MSFDKQSIRDRLLVAIGATSDIENVHVKRCAVNAALPEVLAILNERAHELEKMIREAASKRRREWAEGNLPPSAEEEAFGMELAAGLIKKEARG